MVDGGLVEWIGLLEPCSSQYSHSVVLFRCGATLGKGVVYLD